MAAYNSETTIAESIESVVHQTFTDWEFILCDDGSSDNTYRIIKEYEARYPGKIIGIQNERNSKLPYSLNHCLQYASGQYIARMDADDRCYPDRLEKQYAFLSAHPEIDVVGTGMTCFDGDRITGQRLPLESPSSSIIGFGVPFFPCHDHDEKGGLRQARRLFAERLCPSMRGCRSVDQILRKRFPRRQPAGAAVLRPGRYGGIQAAQFQERNECIQDPVPRIPRKRLSRRTVLVCVETHDFRNGSSESQISDQSETMEFREIQRVNKQAGFYLLQFHTTILGTIIEYAETSSCCECVQGAHSQIPYPFHPSHEGAGLAGGCGLPPG